MSPKCLFLSLLMIGLSFASLAQCNLDQKVSVEAPKPGSGSKIVLTLKTTEAQVSLKMYDIMDAKFPLIAEKNVAHQDAPVNIEFDNLKKGTYSIIAYWKDCSYNIGGIKGIRIDKTSEE